MPFWKGGHRFFETHKSEPRPTRSEPGVACTRAIRRTGSPRKPSSEISEGTAVLSTEIFWRAFGATRPPNVRYGTVLRAGLTSETMPYQQKFL
jgi:hypothetical protein